MLHRVRGAPPGPAPPPPPPPASTSPELPTVRYKTTSEPIARANLDAAITRARTSGQGATEVALRLRRARFFGTVSDFDAVVAIAEAPFEGSPTAADFALRATARAALHRFDDALRDLEEAQRRSDPRDDLQAELQDQRLTIWQAQGKSAKVYAARKRAADEAPTYRSLTMLAGVEADLGRWEVADALYVAAQERYRGVSPFMVAWVDFTRGVMWAERAGDDTRGEQMYRAALARLPSYLVANVHLAEMDVAAQREAEALRRLTELVGPDVDPELIGTIAGLQRGADATKSRALATQIYDRLLATHRAAFLDHGSEFFADDDPRRALALALENLEVRKTERAHQLVLDLALAVDDVNLACSVAESLPDPVVTAGLIAVLDELRHRCAR